MKPLILGLWLAAAASAQVAVEFLVSTGYVVTPRVRSASIEQLESWRKMQVRTRGESVWYIPANPGVYEFRIRKTDESHASVVRFTVEGGARAGREPLRIDFKQIKAAQAQLAPGIAMEAE